MRPSSSYVVIAGGTDGIGRGLALAQVALGAHVVAIGSNPDKGQRLLADCEHSPGSVTFVAADLSTRAGCQSVIDRVLHEIPAIDALVFCANRQNAKRRETVDGLEATFALYYLSRYLLGEGLLDRLERAPRPVIVNVAGPGIAKGRIHWDDLQLQSGYRGMRAQLQAGRANDLLAVAFAAAHPEAKTRYVLYHPGFTDTGFTGIGQPMRTLIGLAARVGARSVADSVAPLMGLVDDPPAAPVSANDRGREVNLSLPMFDPEAALRLRAATQLLARDHEAA